MSLSTMAMSDRHDRLRIRTVSVDPRARQASIDGRLLDLTTLEFDLLAYLAARPGHVFSRDQLLRAVWDSTADWQQPATVTEHIRRLRVKIETEPRHPLILRTVRGAGYRMDNPEVHGGVDAADIALELAPRRIGWYDERARLVPVAERCRVRSEDLLQRCDGLEGVFEMIEAQPRREQAEVRFRRMLDALELFALVTDVDGCLAFMNRAMLTRLGVEPSQVLGKRLALLQPNGEEQHQAFLSAIATGVITPEWENEIAVADGSTRRVRWSSTFVRDGQGRIEAVASIGEDITVRRRLEEQVRRAVRMESLGRLAGGVAHDFNNFLTVVRGHVDLLAQAPELAETSSDHLEQITTGIDRAARLTRQLLAYGRQQVMEPREVSVGDVLQHLRTMLAPMLGTSVAIEIVRHTDDDVVVIDPTQLDQVLVNLAMNARDAMPDGGVLRFEVSTTHIDEAMGALLDVVAGSYVTLSVTDTGDGIPTDLLEHVFEPFVTTKPDGTGTGLGLATVSGIIAQSGGAITADSRPGTGATFVIHLPAPG